MKKFNLRRLTSLCIASVLTVTLSSCSKMNKNGEQEETAAIYTTDNLNEREHIYDETVHLPNHYQNMLLRIFLKQDVLMLH